MLLYTWTYIIKITPYYCFSLCTRRLYGTYSEHRSPLAVLISRWIFVFLILHNLTAMASYGAYIASKYEVCPDCLDTAAFVRNILEEVLLFLIVLAVPGSYIIAWLCQCICGIDDDRNTLEMDKIDKVYQEVNSTNYICTKYILIIFNIETNEVWFEYIITSITGISWSFGEWI